MLIHRTYRITRMHRTRRMPPMLAARSGQQQDVPHFALPTTASLIHDLAETPKQAQLVLDSHEACLRTYKAVGLPAA